MKQRKKIFKKETKGLGHPPAASDLFLENKEMLGAEGIKGNISGRPISSVYQKTKIYPSIYINNHIDTQPTESHSAERSLPLHGLASIPQNTEESTSHLQGGLIAFHYGQ